MNPTVELSAVLSGHTHIPIHTYTYIYFGPNDEQLSVVVKWQLVTKG